MASQKHKSDSTILKLETEITALTEQLIQTHQQNTDYDELMKQTAIVQNSMQDLEAQNDILRKTIESYESRFSELQVQLEKIHFEVNFEPFSQLAFSSYQTFYFSERKSYHRNREFEIGYHGQKQTSIRIDIGST